MELVDKMERKNDNTSVDRHREMQLNSDKKYSKHVL